MSVLRRAPLVTMLVTMIAMGAAMTSPATAADTPAETVTADGLRYTDTELGTGATPTKGQVVSVDYTGWLYVHGKKGTKFDSSLDRGVPISFPLGEGRVIKGWDEGLATMRVGGKRTLIIPPALGYGSRGAGGVIPPGATLLFEVALLGAN